MSTFRSVFVSKPHYPFFEEIDVELDLIKGKSTRCHRLNEVAINRHFFGGFKYKHNKGSLFTFISIRRMAQL